MVLINKQQSEGYNTDLRSNISDTIEPEVINTNRAIDPNVRRRREVVMGTRIPPDKINLRLILVSGKTKDFLFDPHVSASDISCYVFEHWPRDWMDESVERAEILRLIYQGLYSL